MSLLLVGGAATYALAPTSEALGAWVASVSTTPGHQAIEGRVQGPHGVTIKIVKHVGGKIIGVGTVKVRAGGHFKLRVTPGNYQVIIKEGSKHVTLTAKVKKGHSEFVVVKVSTSGGPALAPVIFNY